MNSEYYQQQRYDPVWNEFASHFAEEGDDAIVHLLSDASHWFNGDQERVDLLNRLFYTPEERSQIMQAAQQLGLYSSSENQDDEDDNNQFEQEEQQVALPLPSPEEEQAEEDEDQEQEQWPVGGYNPAMSSYYPQAQGWEDQEQWPVGGYNPAMSSYYPQTQ